MFTQFQFKLLHLFKLLNFVQLLHFQLLHFQLLHFHKSRLIWLPSICVCSVNSHFNATNDRLTYAE